MPQKPPETSAPEVSSGQPRTTAESLPHQTEQGGSEPGRRDAVSRLELKPLDPLTLEMAIGHDFDYVKEKAQIHDIRAGRWYIVSSWSRLIVAFSAAISSVSLLADNLAVTTTFSILTAAIAALTAAFNPPDTATQHRQAAKDYALVWRRLDLLWRRLQPFGPDSRHVGGAQARRIPDLSVIYTIYLQYRSDIEAADDRAPVINRLAKRRASRGAWDQPPQSWLELRRLRTSLKYQLAAKVAYNEYETKSDNLR